MRLFPSLAIAALVAIADPAAAKEPLTVATPGTTEPVGADIPTIAAPDDDSSQVDADLTGALNFGRVFVDGANPGFYGRFDFGTTLRFKLQKHLVVGTFSSFEGWASPRDDSDELNGGGTLAVMAYVGVISPFSILSVGIGSDVLLLDHVHGDTGFGGYAPAAMAQLGVGSGPLRFVADARISYRWQLGAEDRTLFRLGGAVQMTFDMAPQVPTPTRAAAARRAPSQTRLSPAAF